MPFKIKMLCIEMQCLFCSKTLSKKYKYEIRFHCTFRILGGEDLTLTATPTSELGNETEGGSVFWSKGPNLSTDKMGHCGVLVENDRYGSKLWTLCTFFSYISTP